MRELTLESLTHYRILERLGAGGMGVVFKARDNRLDRIVAIKIMRAELVADADRKRRFISEARAASALNHPNIVTVYDIGSENGTDFIVMEYVVGKSLAEICQKKALPLSQCLAYAIQIAAALAVAHRASVIHRDLKPGNIVVGPDGQIKLLDFGLAKLIRPDSSSDGVHTAETITVADAGGSLTESGQILGTVSYMSPEQFTGGKVDSQTDIFSFGVLLYEIVTGSLPFHGPSVVETAAEILRREPRNPRDLVPTIPRPLERIIVRCLQKDPDERFHSIADVGRLLEDVRADLATRPESDASAVPLQRPARNWKLFSLGSVGLLLLAALGFSAWHLHPAAEDDATVLTRLTFDPGLTTDPAVSSDGRMLAFASDRNGHSNLDIWVRQLAGGEPLQITRDRQTTLSPISLPTEHRSSIVRIAKAAVFI